MRRILYHWTSGEVQPLPLFYEPSPHSHTGPIRPHTLICLHLAPNVSILGETLWPVPHFPQSTEASLSSLLVLEHTPPLSCHRALALAASTARDVLSQVPTWPTPSHTPSCSHVTLFMRPTLTTYLNGNLPPHLPWAPNSLSSPFPLFLSLHISDHFLTSCTSVILLFMIFLPQPECGSMTAELFVLFTDIPKNSKQCLAAHSRYSINIHWMN